MGTIRCLSATTVGRNDLWLPAVCLWHPCNTKDI